MNDELEDDFYPDEYDEWDDDDDDELMGCGPWCGSCWGGDGICMQELEAMAEEGADYETNHVQHDVPCPVCGKQLTQYDVETDKLWVWPGGWYSTYIALNVYAVYDCPKGEIHQQEGVYHIWIGEGDYRREQLIRLLGEPQEVESE